MFVWSMYLAFGPDGYIRYGLDDPMAALASRTAGFNEYLHNPPWAAEWIVEQARAHRIDGALVLRPRSMKPAATGRLFIERALEDAGIPGAADRGGCRGRSRVGSRGDADGGANVSRHAGARMTTIAAARVWPTAWMLPFGGDARRDVRAAAVEPRLLAAAAVDSAGVRHELHAARAPSPASTGCWRWCSACRPASAPGVSARSECSRSDCSASRRAACCSAKRGASSRRSRFAA